MPRVALAVPVHHPSAELVAAVLAASNVLAQYAYVVRGCVEAHDAHIFVFSH